MFFRGKKRPAPDKIIYNPSAMSPAIHASICTGEQTAGFISRETGAFTGVMLINSPEDRKRFCKEFGIKDADIKTIY